MSYMLKYLKIKDMMYNVLQNNMGGGMAPSYIIVAKPRLATSWLLLKLDDGYAVMYCIILFEIIHNQKTILMP